MSYIAGNVLVMRLALNVVSVKPEPEDWGLLGGGASYPKRPLDH